jgi:ribosome-associated protein YbcJ (S4-like RNA binding protein)
MEKFQLTSGYIELNKLLKFLHWSDSGGHAKHLIQSSSIYRNGIPETRVRAKLVDGDTIRFGQMEVRIEQAPAEPLLQDFAEK